MAVKFVETLTQDLFIATAHIVSLRFCANGAWLATTADQRTFKLHYNVAEKLIKNATLSPLQDTEPETPQDNTT